MKSHEFIKESGSDTLYHCTLTKHLPKINTKGICPLQTSNWVKAGDGERYGGGYIFAFTAIDDAVRWAGKWDWEVSKNIGSGQISIITFEDDGSKWEEDDGDPMGQAGSAGKWLRKLGTVKPEQFKDIVPVTTDMIRELMTRQYK